MTGFQIRQSLLLLLTATIWGIAFVAQSVGMAYVGPYTFNAVRFLLGALVLLPVLAFGKKQADNTGISIRSGIICGIILAIASNLQQIGIQYTSVGKAGFITALYIVLVPIFGIFLKKKAGIKIWIGVAIAAAGLYLLCMKGDSFTLARGDVFVLLCAVMFSFHILFVDSVTARVNGVLMACVQFATAAVFSGVFMILLEKPDFGTIVTAWQPIVYAGVFSCGIAYTLQIVGQKGMNPTVASLIMSLESVISVIAGFLLLGQVLSGRETLGCVLMFAAIVLVQLPGKKQAAVSEDTEKLKEAV